MYIQMFGSDLYLKYDQSLEGLKIEHRAMPIVGALYFLSFVLLGTMVMLKLVIGVIINGMKPRKKWLTAVFMNCCPKVNLATNRPSVPKKSRI